MFHATLLILSRKYFFRFFEICTYPSIVIYNFWTRSFPLVMRSFKAGFPLATRARKYFSKSAPTPRYTNFDSRLTPCNAISDSRKAGLNLGTRARERELCPYRYVSKITRIKKFSTIFLSFSGNHFSPRLIISCSL